jgi:hypothetical protein
MRLITVPSSAVALRAEKPLTPAMVAAVWEVAGALDAARLPANLANAHWLEISTARLRGEGGRSDNVWLRECLDRLTGIKLAGEFRGDPWGAVALAEWHIVDGGTVARLLIPPAGVHALRSPGTFAKIEADAAHRLSGHGQRLYAILADKKRLDQPSWTFPLSELRALFGVSDQRSYDRFNNFRARVLDPAMAAINDFGTVKVTMAPEKLGRSVSAVRFYWEWRDVHEASETVAENERHSSARRRKQGDDDAPPMIPASADDPAAVAAPARAAASLSRADLTERAMAWFGSLPADVRDEWADRVGRVGDRGNGPEPRPERIIAMMAYEAAFPQAGQN